MALIPQPLSRFNLAQSSILVLQQSGAEMELYVQMLCGFGAKDLHRAGTMAEAVTILGGHEIDLVLVDAKLPDGEGYEFVRTLRRQGSKVNFTPVLMVAGHTPRSQVTLARDCGAHFVVRKPVSAGLLLQRILWIAQETRPFLETETYIGPDRRFQNVGPPDGEGRRRDDLTGDVGDPEGPHMNQAEVDQLLRPRRAVG